MLIPQRATETLRVRLPTVCLPVKGRINLPASEFHSWNHSLQRSTSEWLLEGAEKGCSRGRSSLGAVKPRASACHFRAHRTHPTVLVIHSQNNTGSREVRKQSFLLKVGKLRSRSSTSVHKVTGESTSLATLLCPSRPSCQVGHTDPQRVCTILCSWFSGEHGDDVSDGNDGGCDDGGSDNSGGHGDSMVIMAIVWL